MTPRRITPALLVGYYAFVIVAWVGTWLAYEAAGIAALPESLRVGFWTMAKVIVWIAPIFVFLRWASIERPADYLGFSNPRRGALVGLAIGAAFVTVSATFDVFFRTFTRPALTPGLLSAVTVAPLFEELMFRGFPLRVLTDARMPFWSANAVAAVMFLGLHLPGWYFAGGLGTFRLVSALSIVLIGVVAGVAKRRAASTWASVVFHFVNNLYAAFVK